MDSAPALLGAVPTGPAWLLRLELELPPEQARGLTGLLPGAARERPRRLRQSWHDTADFALAGDGMALSEQRQGGSTRWRLERIATGGQIPWPPLTTTLDEAGRIEAFGDGLPAGLRAASGFEGRLQRLTSAEGVALDLLNGRLRAGAAERPCCLVALSGPAEATAALARQLAATLDLRVAERRLAEAALALAGHSARGAPGLPVLQEAPVCEAFTQLAGGLAAMLFREAERAGPEEPEPVHQMRVAARRLRSAMRLFRPALGCAEMAECDGLLRELMRTLGPARDWDVFARGTAMAVRRAFPEEAAVQRLLLAAERRRLAAYAGLRQHLSSPGYRQLGIALAALLAGRPWETPGEDAAAAARRVEMQAMPLAAFAARALNRRLRRLGEPGAEIAELPAETLHRLRLDCKRLRYAAEFCAPLFPGQGARRFIRRLATLQDGLGHLNDGVTAAALMAELKAAHSFAGGLVWGFVAAQAQEARDHVGEAWRKFHRLDPFWR